MAIADLIGSSPKFRAVLDEIKMVAPVDSAVLVQGETGTGKEVIAQAIHDASPRRHLACGLPLLGLLAAGGGLCESTQVRRGLFLENRRRRRAPR